jgi:hypothetical protein
MSPRTVEVVHGYLPKLARAERQLESLNSAIAKFTESHIHTPDLQMLDVREKRCKIEWKGVTEPPIEWSVDVGEFAHNLRSALEHLMWNLVLVSDGDPGPHTAFPVCNSEADWDARALRSTDGPPPTAGLDDKALAFVKDQQPFIRDQPKPGDSAVFKLIELNNIDKHRTLQIPGFFTTEKARGLRFEPAGYVSIRNVRYAPAGQWLQNGTVIASADVRLSRPLLPGTVMRVPFTQHVSVAFGELGKFYVATNNDLRLILDRVTQIVREARPLVTRA